MPKTSFPVAPPNFAPPQGAASFAALRHVLAEIPTGITGERTGTRNRRPLLSALTLIGLLIAGPAFSQSATTFTVESVSDDKFTAILKNPEGHRLKVSGTPRNTDCFSIDVNGVVSLWARTSPVACDQTIVMAFSSETVDISTILFDNIDDMDGDRPRDAFAATVPGTWSSPYPGKYQSAPPNGPYDSDAGTLSVYSLAGDDFTRGTGHPAEQYDSGRSRFIAAGAVGSFLVRDTHDNPINDSGRFVLDTPVTAFKILMDDGQGDRGARLNFDLSVLPAEVYYFPEVDDEIGVTGKVTSDRVTLIDVLDGDTDTDGDIVVSSLRITGTDAAGNSLTVVGQGVWSIEAGKIAFTPEAGFFGDPDPITYTVKDNTDRESAAATVSVDYAYVVAADDDATGTPINGHEGGATGSLLTNDTLNDVAVDPTAVSATVTDADGLSGLAVNAKGALELPAGTSAGSYDIGYELCEDAVPGNCDTARVRVEVSAAPIVAADDAPGVIDGRDGGSTLSVLDNDTLNGRAINPSKITLTPGTAPAPARGAISMAADGRIEIAAGTTADTYSYAYEICEDLNPGNCAAAQASISVSAAALVATNDLRGPHVGRRTSAIDGAALFANDTIGGDPADLSEIAVTAGSIDGIGLASDGTISLDRPNPVGRYTRSYEICEILNPANCTTGDLSLEVSAAAIAAAADEAGTPPGRSGGTAADSVFANDLLDGAAPAAEEVSLRVETPDTAGRLTLDAEGRPVLAAGTPAGTYSLGYEICETLNPGNCATATASLEALAAVLAPEADAFDRVNRPAGYADMGNIFANDLIDSVALSADDIDLTVDLPAGSPLSIAQDGTVSVASETPNGRYEGSYRICEALNPGNCAGPITVTVSLTVRSLRTIELAENGTGIDGYTPDAAESWALWDADAGLFALGADGGLTFKSAPDFEAPADVDADNVYEVTVTATDATGVEIDQGLLIRITDLDEIAPALTGPEGQTDATAATATAENQTTVADYAADEDVAWSLSGADAALFEIAADGALSFRAAPDFEAPADANGDNAYEVIVTATDARGNATAQALTVTVTDLDEIAPTLTGPESQTDATAATATAENQTTVADYAADEDVAWSLSGADAPLFEIAADGALSFRAAPDFEVPADADGDNAYEVAVTATDARGNPTAQALTVTVTDLDEIAPTLTGPESQTSAAAATATTENQTTVAGYAADEDVTWSLSGADAALFEIAADGALTFKTAPDFEAPADADGDNAYEVVVTATDARGNATAQALTVTVTDLDEIAPRITGPAAPSMAENRTAVAVYTADEDVVWSLSGADADLFEIAADGALSFRAAPDFEAPADAGADNLYTLTLTASDARGNVSDLHLTVTLSDVAEIVAEDDSLAVPVPGRAGAETAIDLLANDTFNGARPTAAEVALRLLPGADLADGRIALSPEGPVSVAAGTPAGRYELGYEICAQDAPESCAQAGAVIDVAAATLALSPDAFGTIPVDGRDGGVAGNVLANDTIDGAAFEADEVEMTLVAASVPGLSIDPDGTLRVGAGTVAGTHDATYRVCEILNPGNCAESTVGIGVDASEIEVADDDLTDKPIYGVAGGVTDPVIANDLLGGAPVVADEVVMSITDDGGLDGVGLDTAGRITVPRLTEPGLYEVGYGVCEALNPENCIEGVARVSVVPIAAVAGTIFDDVDRDGRFDPGRDRGVGAGYRVVVIDAEGVPQPIFDAEGQPVEFVTTDAEGDYELYVDAGAGYRVVMYSPGGEALGGFGIGDLEPGQRLENQNLPIDPSGVIYDSVTRDPIVGVRVTLTDAAGRALPARCLADPAQQNQVTGADGFYRFDVAPAAAPECPTTETEYRIAMDLPGGFEAGASTRLPVASEAAFDATTCIDDPIPGGNCEISASANPPAAGETARYFLSFLLEAGDPNVINNHIAVDATLADPLLDFTALTEEATRGTALPFRIVAREVEYGRIDVEDLLPQGFVYAEGSARVNGRMQEPEIDGRRLRFAGLSPDASDEIEITLSIVAAGEIGDGRHVSTALLRDPDDGTVLARAEAAVSLVPERVFDCGDVVGRVYEDRDGDGHADADEPGLGGMVLRAPGGETVLTDAHGRFSVPCAMLPRAGIGSNMQLKLDERALPEGWIPSTPNPQVTRLTRGKMARMDFGVQPGRKAVLQLTDAAFGPDGQLLPEWQDGMRELIGALAEGPTRLGLVYLDPSRTDIARARLDALSDAISRHHTSGASRQPLVLETLIRGDAR